MQPDRGEIGVGRDSCASGGEVLDPADIEEVYLPLENVKKCGGCGKGGERLRICSSCGEIAYCGAECQKKDWPVHKRKCGKTDRIDLKSFYPLLAVLMEYQRCDPLRPINPALRHKIINSPNPSEGTCTFPDGSKARLILLGEEMPIERVLLSQEDWWPTAITPAVRQKLFQRFLSEHYLLPSILAVLVALMSELYTTTYVPASESPTGSLQRRIRLKYHNSPIADFGIVKGWADVESQDMLAYYSVKDGTFFKGQDPTEEHYWMYFTTAAGEDFILDCGMFVYNLCIMVEVEPHYTRHHLPPMTSKYAPAFFRDREYKHNAPNIQHEKERFSVLRDPRLIEAVRCGVRSFDRYGVTRVCAFMERVAGRKCTNIEKDLVMHWITDSCGVIRGNLQRQEHLNFPAEPNVGIQTDPGEMDDHDKMPPDENEAWLKYMKKWNRKQRKGKINHVQLAEAFRAWGLKSREEKLGLVKDKTVKKTASRK